MILSGKEIKRLVKQGRIKITPFDPGLVGAGSIDLRLGNTFRVFKKHPKSIAIHNEVDYTKGSTLIKLKKGESITIQPGHFVTANTVEEIDLPVDIAGWLEGRSSLARLGIAIHITAGYVHPGSKGKQVLEISNVSSSSVALFSGTRICQLVLEEVKNPGKRYSGRFAGQKRP